MGSGRIAPPVLDLDTRCRWVVSFMLRPLYPQGSIPPPISWIGGWMGPRAGLDAVSKRKIQLMNRLKTMQNLNTWGWHQQITKKFMRKWRADRIQGTPTNVQSRIPVSYKKKKLKTKVYKTVTLPAAPHGCETRSLILREEHRLRVFEKRGIEESEEGQRGDGKRISSFV
jgi:hypothetical protein